MLYLDGKYALAAERLRAAAALDPQSFVAQFNLAQALSQLDQSYAAIEAFEKWSRARLAATRTFTFGRVEHAIPHFGDTKTTPAAQARDAKGRTWVLFQWYRFGRSRFWLTRKLAEGKYSDPVVVPVPIKMGTGPQGAALKIKGDVLHLTSSGRDYRFTLQAALAEID